MNKYVRNLIIQINQQPTAKGTQFKILLLMENFKTLIKFVLSITLRNNIFFESFNINFCWYKLYICMWCFRKMFQCQCLDKWRCIKMACEIEQKHLSVLNSKPPELSCQYFFMWTIVLLQKKRRTIIIKTHFIVSLR